MREDISEVIQINHNSNEEISIIETKIELHTERVTSPVSDLSLPQRGNHENYALPPEEEEDELEEDPENDEDSIHQCEGNFIDQTTEEGVHQHCSMLSSGDE
jgi:hypothetical protein